MNPRTAPNPMAAPKPALTDDLFEQITTAAMDTWQRHADANEAVFQEHIRADFAAARRTLAGLHPRHDNFLELGSGVGVITILADLLGFDAYGIEIQPELVDASIALAESVGSRATFAEGSFVPLEFRDEVELLDSDRLTPTEGADALAELGMAISDFDLVYAYPYPGEEAWFEELVRRHGDGHPTLLLYSVADGFQVSGPQ